ncbi:hypothetical protein BH24GEM3_BH24GEM3_01030 [soil metagenome]
MGGRHRKGRIRFGREGIHWRGGRTWSVRWAATPTMRRALQEGQTPRHALAVGVGRGGVGEEGLEVLLHEGIEGRGRRAAPPRQGAQRGREGRSRSSGSERAHARRQGCGGGRGGGMAGRVNGMPAAAACADGIQSNKVSNTPTPSQGSPARRRGRKNRAVPWMSVQVGPKRKPPEDEASGSNPLGRSTTARRRSAAGLLPVPAQVDRSGRQRVRARRQQATFRRGCGYPSAPDTVD